MLNPAHLVVMQAEKTGRRILEIYQSPNREFRELPELMEEMDPLRDFSEACRRELQMRGASEARQADILGASMRRSPADRSSNRSLSNSIAR